MSYQVTERPKPQRIVYACDGCGSRDGEMKAWCKWNTDIQEWVFAEDPNDDTFYCNGCKDCPADLDIETCE